MAQAKQKTDSRFHRVGRRVRSWLGFKKTPVTQTTESEPNDGHESTGRSQEQDSASHHPRVLKKAHSPTPSSMRETLVQQPGQSSQSPAGSQPSTSDDHSGMLINDIMQEADVDQLYRTLNRRRKSTSMREAPDPFIITVRVLRTGENYKGFDKAQPRKAKLDSGSAASFMYLTTVRELGYEPWFLNKESGPTVKLLGNETTRPIGEVPIYWFEDADKKNPPTKHLTNFLVLADPSEAATFDFLLGADFLLPHFELKRNADGSQISLEQSQESIEALFVAMRWQRS